MKRIYLIITGLFLFSGTFFAQKVSSKKAPKPEDVGIAVITRNTLEAHLAFLASDALEGRAAGKNSGRVAAEYIKAVLLDAGISPLYNSYFQSFDAFAPHSGDYDIKTRFQVHADSVAKIKQVPYYRRLGLQNVLGFIEGQRKDEYVVVGAHYDHLDIDEFLAGDRIFNGADDNASGVAAVLQVAKAFAVSGKKPLRSVIFAFWDAEEYGFLGSEYFVAHFNNSAAIKGYINLDMVGREGSFPAFLLENPNAVDAAQEKNPNKIYFLRTADATGYGEQLDKDLASHHQDVRFAPRILLPAVRASDDHSFSNKNIPVLWFFTGIHPDYHTPDDEAGKINWDKLLYITQATYLSLWNLAN
ncbi:MAG: M20/M25/M40 family metallo-hydrolase [Bacteroidales bacterium]|nr:M20/M25/M40 family metallo-hydrolase [Bacteroidales bacterium]